MWRGGSLESKRRPRVSTGNEAVMSIVCSLRSEGPPYRSLAGPQTATNISLIATAQAHLSPPLAFTTTRHVYCSVVGFAGCWVVRSVARNVYAARKLAIFVSETPHLEATGSSRV